MYTLDRQERVRARYKQIKAGYRPALEIYTEIMDDLVDGETLLLDAGCGPGGLVKGIVGHAHRVTGVDRYISAFVDQLEIPEAVEAELSALPFAANTFTLITCSWVLEHLPDPAAVFREFSRVLQPGGHAIFITPNKRNYAVWLRRLIPSTVSQRIVHAIYARDEHFINPTYYRANTQRDIDAAMRAADLRAVRFEHISDPSYLAFNEPLFRVSVVIEGLIDRFSPTSRVHLVGVYRKD
jgi:ubiquinone/menaquinone biosynthesis C-methylase UbiE